MQWWNSIETLTWVTNAAKAITVAAGIATGFVGLFMYVAGLHLDRLKAEASRDEKRANVKFQEDLNASNRQLQEQNAELQQEVIKTTAELENIRTSAASTAKKQGEDADSIRLMQALSDELAPDFSRDFPLGYSLLTIAGKKHIIPFQDTKGEPIVLDWTKCKVLNAEEHDIYLRDTSDILLQLPDMVIGNEKIDLKENYIRVPSKVNNARYFLLPSDKSLLGNLHIVNSDIQSIKWDDTSMRVVVGMVRDFGGKKIIIIGAQPFQYRDPAKPQLR